MSKSLDDVLAELRQKSTPHLVAITLTIHSQAKNIYYGYGSVRYFASQPQPTKELPFPFIAPLINLSPNEYLESSQGGQVKVLNNINYSLDNTLRGSWGDYQTFLAKEPASELWNIRIDPPFQTSPRFRFLSQSQPHIAITMPGIALPAANWLVYLTDDDAFLRGIGPDPVAPNEKALYTIAFGDIWPHVEIG